MRVNRCHSAENKDWFIHKDSSSKQSSTKEGLIDDNFSYFLSKPYVVTPHLNCVIEMVQVRGYNICLYAELTKQKLSLIITKYSLLSKALSMVESHLASVYTREDN